MSDRIEDQMNNATIRMMLTTITAGLLATGCATTSVKTTKQGAPITYKIGQGGTQYASLNLKDRMSRPSLPRYNASPDALQPRGGQGHHFDQSKVDRQLYSHQKVGKTYTIMGGTYTPRHEPNYDVVGEASWYGPKFHGKPTATGEIFDKRAITAAHKTLPLNSILVVTNLENGRVLNVRLNDRGPFIGNRIIDLSEAAAEALGFKQNGLAKVRVQYAGPADPMAKGRTFEPNLPRMVELPQENMVEAPRPTTPRPVVPRSVTPSPVMPSPIDPCLDLNASTERKKLLPASCQSVNPIIPDFTAPQAQAPVRPVAPRRAPEADLPNGADITLTIKGPIHIAKSDESDPDPQFIAERLKTK